MRLGVRAHDCGKLSPEELAKKVSQKGFTSVQLALLKAIDGFDTNFGRLNPGMAYYIGEAFRKENVQIAVLGCYLNLAHPDLEERNKIIDRYKEHIRYVRDFGCSIVGTETGSLNGDYSYNDENHGEKAFEIFISSLREIVKESEKFGVFVGIEGVSSHIINTPKRMKRVIDDIDSNNLQVILDPVNYLTIENYKNQDDIINECFELFGDRIVVLHAKDFVFEDSQIKSVTIGKGILNYELLFKHIKNERPYLNVLFEESKEEDMEFSREYLSNLYEKIN